MALFKPFHGNRNDLDTVPKVSGHAYFCIDDGSFWIDIEDSEGIVQRIQTSAAVEDLIIKGDTQLIFDGGDANVTLAVLDDTILE
jgi:hypothetical protein